MPRHRYTFDGGLTRVTCETSHVWLFFYERWSAKSQREVWRRNRSLFDIGSWFSGGRWVHEGDPPPFDVEYYNASGNWIDFRLLNPAVSTGTGWKEVYVHFGWIGRQPSDLGVDTRTIRTMIMKFAHPNGEPREITQT